MAMLPLWLQWLPWRLLIKRAAKATGFIDPIAVLARFRSFAQPAQVGEPVELLRSGAVFHARGLLNTQAIQHNLDWVWPFWVEKQFNPRDESFVPRAFSITHVNLTHRNWTAVGIPGCEAMPLVDPRGLLTPRFDGWSIEPFFITAEGESLYPSRASRVYQVMEMDDLAVRTRIESSSAAIEERASVDYRDGAVTCRLGFLVESSTSGNFVISFRPYNAEGISFINDLECHNQREWLVNREDRVSLSETPDYVALSDYRRGDVLAHLKPAASPRLHCPIGMASGAAVFSLQPGSPRSVTVEVCLDRELRQSRLPNHPVPWAARLENSAALECPEPRFSYLFEAAKRTLVLLSPHEVYPGPYTYKRFWFRDAAFMAHALLTLGYFDVVSGVLSAAKHRQSRAGYWLSQEGEWDSNGEVLWLLYRYFRSRNLPSGTEWRASILSAAEWILRIRESHKESKYHGLLPAGFSAEHLGPIDHYYWDNFWAIAGLRAAAALLKDSPERHAAERFQSESESYLRRLDEILLSDTERLGEPLMPAAPGRRMDSGAVGSIVSGYPLQLLAPNDVRMRATVNYMLEHFLVGGGFFQNMIHSGVNAYLTLHLAQNLLRLRDERQWALVQTVASFASDTGQWPEAIHPRTRGGCMGDGQHGWAAAEWIMMIANWFAREEGEELILLSGLPRHWLSPGTRLSLGPLYTLFGKLEVAVVCGKTFSEAEVRLDLHTAPAEVKLCLRGHKTHTLSPGTREVRVKLRRGAAP